MSVWSVFGRLKTSRWSLWGQRESESASWLTSSGELSTKGRPGATWVTVTLTMSEGHSSGTLEMLEGRAILGAAGEDEREGRKREGGKMASLIALGPQACQSSTLPHNCISSQSYLFWTWFEQLLGLAAPSRTLHVCTAQRPEILLHWQGN